MATIASPWSGDAAMDVPGGVAFARVGEADRRRALALLLTGHARDDEPAVEPLLRYVGELGLSLEDLWVATHRQAAVAAVLILPNAGRTAMAFVSPCRDATQEAITVALLRCACDQQDPRRVALIQALIEPGQRSQSSALSSAGFSMLANLVYLHRSTDLPPMPLRLPADVTVRTWDEALRSRFERAILASYEQTLDCPGLLGLRTIEDVVQGHQATGRFVPSLWHLLERGGEPVGVMLLNLLPGRGTMELVYLGLAPSMRGRGLARSLLTYALGLAPQHDATTLVLAVDEANAPALRLYRRLGFGGQSRRTAMIRVVNAPADAAG